MGIRLIILLGALAAVLYSIHILIKDYQSLTASKVLRFLFKREANYHNTVTGSVRWGEILRYDRVQCARYLYCELGAQPPDNETQRGFISMIHLEPKEEDREAYEQFKSAFYLGQASGGRQDVCTKEYYLCPLKKRMLFKIVEYLLKNNQLY